MPENKNINESSLVVEDKTVSIASTATLIIESMESFDWTGLTACDCGAGPVDCCYNDQTQTKD